MLVSLSVDRQFTNPSYTALLSILSGLKKVDRKSAVLDLKLTISLTPGLARCKVHGDLQIWLRSQGPGLPASFEVPLSISCCKSTLLFLER
jgi:hypothetical protein